MTEELYGGKEVRAEAEVEEEDEVVIRIENVHKTYLLGVEGVPALRGVSLSVKRGEFVIIYGLSGGGKTTLLNIIGTIDKPTKGELYLGGEKITSNTPDKVMSYLRLKKIGFVFQTFNLLSSLTALENVELPMILDGTLSVRERRERAIELLEKVGVGKRLDHVPSQLSGGEQQRVTIARAISNKPELLLLDEPTGDLDSENTCKVLKQLIQLNREENITLVMITHDVSLKNLSDRVIWMRDGKILKTEIVSEEKRQKKLNELDEEIESFNIGKKNKGKIKWKNTYIRKPEDYPTHPNHLEREPQLVNFQKVFKNIKDFSEITQEDYEREINLVDPNKNIKFEDEELDQILDEDSGTQLVEV
jgi:putative ABC transport system ATP-binding protein